MSVAASVRASWSLRRRLVLGIVALLSLLSIVIGAVSVLTLRQTLIDRLDSQLFAAMKRSSSVPSGRRESATPRARELSD